MWHRRGEEAHSWSPGAGTTKHLRQPQQHPGLVGKKESTHELPGRARLLEANLILWTSWSGSRCSVRWVSGL